MKYRKKPVIVDVYKTDKEVIIHTLEGDMKADIGDYIVIGIKGEQYPLKPDIFEATYESIETNKTQLCWIIEDYKERTENPYKLCREVLKRGHKGVLVKYYDLIAGSTVLCKGNSRNLIINGSIPFVKYMNKNFGDRILTTTTEKNYNCSTYYAYFGKYLLNEDYFMCPAGDLMRIHNEHYNQSNMSNLFIRPDSGFKPFIGKVFNTAMESFDKDWQEVLDTVGTEGLLVFAPAKVIISEWRFIVTKGEIIAGSQYRCNKELNYSSEYPLDITDLVIEISRIWQPDPIFVIDICQATDGKYYLLEIGSFACAGLYACDLSKSVERVNDIMSKECEDIVENEIY